MRLTKFARLAAVPLTVLGLMVAVPAVADASGPVFTVMNTSETPPDGVYFRNSAHPSDTSRITGLGVYKNERVQLQCYAWGDAVGGYRNSLWYKVANVSRPTAGSRADVGYLNGHYVNDGKNANQVDAGVPQCGAATTSAPVNPTYNRSASVAWAEAHAQDPQANGTLCTWFVSNSLWAGGFAQTSEWRAHTYAGTYVQGLVEHVRSHVSSSWSNITANLTTNAVPNAVPGDIIVYDWGDGGTTFDHMSFVVDIASGQYPNVSEWGQFDFSRHPEYKLTHPRSPYVQRGWTWSTMHQEWLQREHSNVKVYLLHINGGYFAPNF
ncbi:amidase domain-containing protein [Amycolatopsis sp. RTGN1]|uniref:amidase domain-containing protein n=1 Tax=Amycolatopsis ponsaeliensis TaxID=2992142 RepID=UPI00254CB4D5|nr:amidase domain-containing protein [Amycolatopsis sp. RTGN1]